MDIPQVVPAIETALARASELVALRKSEHSLTLALKAGRQTSMAVGLVMERYKLNRKSAFELLRQHARTNQLKINQIAEDLLNAADTLNLPEGFFNRMAGSKSAQ